MLFVEDVDFIKTKTKDISLSSFRTYNSILRKYLSKKEFVTLKNKYFTIQKSDQGNSIVIVERDKYIKKMENFLIDQKTNF